MVNACFRSGSVMLGLLCSVFAASNELKPVKNNLPIVVNTWGFTNATASAWTSLMSGNKGVDAVVDGCTTCEVEQCDRTVGYGGSPDETSETTLDALVMDGVTHDVGAVGCLRGVKNAVGVARAIMLYSKHTMLVGELATAFAKEMGFEVTSLSTPQSIQMWQNWKDRDCQPNFRQNVQPDPTTSCGPYSPKSVKSRNHVNDVVKTLKSSENERYNKFVDERHHDTIGMVIVDADGNLAAGTSTNGAGNKIPGRVGDSPIPGAGAYVDNDVGGAAATGDGDVMMRFLPSYHAVERMRNGDDPSMATADALSRILKFYPNFSGAVVAVTKNGEHGAACNGMSQFPYSVRAEGMQNVTIFRVPCISKS